MSTSVTDLGWVLQVLALVVVGTALLIGLVYGSMGAELTMLGVGGALFLVGRWLQKEQG